MKKITVWLLLALLSGQARAEYVASEHPQLVRIRNPRANDITRLERLGADIAHRRRDAVELVVPPRTRLRPALAEALGHVRDLEVIVPDLDVQVRRLGPNLGGYHSWASLNAELTQTAQNYPQITRLVTLGTTVEGRELKAMRVGVDRGDPAKPGFMFTGLHHAREWISMEVPMGLLSTLTTQYTTNSDIQHLVNTRDIWIVPVVNPDGLVYSQSEYAMWRKNRRPNPDGSVGVDPNRNYGYQWGGPASGSDPDSETYHGPSAFSEPCTRAIRDMVQTHHIVCDVEFHSYAEEIMWPWGYTDTQPPDQAVFLLHATRMAEISGYELQTNASYYPTNGDCNDYMYGTHHSLSYTIELGREFIPPSEQIADIVDKNVRCCLYLLKNAAGGIAGPRSPGH